MGKKIQRPANVRTEVPRDDGTYSVKDEWPTVSYSGKYRVASRIETRVTAGKVFVEIYRPGERSETLIYDVGESFAQEPGVVYAVGSMPGGETESVSDDPIPMKVALVSDLGE